MRGDFRTHTSRQPESALKGTPMSKRLMNLPRALAAAALAVCLMPAIATAAWPHASAANLGVATTTNAETVLATCADGQGGTILVYQNNDPYGNGIYAQRIDANGRLAWTPGGVFMNAETALPGSCSLVPDGSGGVTLVWATYWTANWNIWGAHLNNAGWITWVAGICAQASAQTSPIAVAGDGGSVIVVWQDVRNGNSDLYAQRIDTGGNQLWAINGVPVVTSTPAQTEPVLASDGNGGAIVAWREASAANAAEVYAQRLTSAGAQAWATNGVAVISAAGDQWRPTIMADGSHGAIIAWHDWRSGNADVYAQRLNNAGALQWSTGGVVLCSAAADQTVPVMAPDGMNGAIVAWQDSRGSDADIYAQRLSFGGVVQWAANGVALCTTIGAQQTPAISSDGTGGAIVAWQDPRTGNQDLYAQRVNGSGVVQWSSGGMPVSTAAWDQSSVILASDGGAGAVAAWVDTRTGSSDIYAQRIDEWGMLGAEPAITKVHDVPNDDGGKVKVSWTASPLDNDPAYRNIEAYLVFRSVPPQKALAAKATSRDPGEAALSGLPFVTGAGDKTYYWEYVASQGAYHLPAYSYLAPTAGDSLAGSNPRTAFLIEARIAGGTRWWTSAPDSGYSVDNLPPNPPVFLASRRVGEVTRVRWLPNAEHDLAGYRLYSGAGPAFVPGAGNLVAAVADTGYVDGVSSPYAWYKLTALDAHGNESTVAVLSPAQISAVPGERLPATGIAGIAPNPFNPATTIAYSLRHTGPVRLAIHDASGRLVRTLVDGVENAGAHEARWDGLATDGRAVASGVYFCRLVGDGACVARSLTLIR
jgi:hypothetical protein